MPHDCLIGVAGQTPSVFSADTMGRGGGGGGFDEQCYNLAGLNILVHTLSSLTLWLEGGVLECLITP